jgi:hypothetical protein
VQLTALLALALAAPPGAPLGAWPGGGFARGAVYSSWDGSYPHRDRWEGHLDRFAELGVTWIQVLTFAHQPAVDAPRIDLMPDAKWPAEFVTEARRRGFRILLKPHVWSRQFYDGSGRWRGSIQMPDDDAWAAWFAEYREFLLREARRAQGAGVEMLSVGVEYVHASTHTAEWKALIAEVRGVYDGLLTYSADGNHELGHVAFWDALDLVGVNAYFALHDPRPDGSTPHGLWLRLRWFDPMLRLGALAARWGKPIVLTEAGYPSVRGATARPWQWPRGDEVVDLGLQAEAYDALLAACTANDWCRGVFWWKWYERPEKPSHARDYDPAGKPAEVVVRRWYRPESTAR